MLSSFANEQKRMDVHFRKPSIRFCYLLYMIGQCVRTKLCNSPLRNLPAVFLFQKSVFIFLMVQTIALCDQRIRFQRNEVRVRVHRTGDLLYVIAVTDIFEDFLIVQGYLRSKHIRFVFHSAFLHIEDIELFEAARFHGFLSVQNIVSDLVEHNDTFHHRMQIVFNEDKSVTHQNLIGSTLPFEIHGDDLNPKRLGDSVRVPRAERIDQSVCCLHDLQSLNIQERTPPSACFDIAILT